MRHLAIIVFVSVNVAYGQSLPDPANDPGWILIPGLSDEFSSAGSINNAKWEYAQPWGAHIYTNSLYCVSDDAYYRSVGASSGATDGYAAKLKIDYDPTTCYDWAGNPYSRNYQAGALFGTNEIKYGYFEIRCRYTDNGIHNYGIGVNFWMWHRWDWSGTYPDVTWSEIDMAEIDASENRHTCNIHYGEPWMDNTGTPEVVEHWFLRTDSAYDYVTSFPSWRKISCLWSPDQIDFFIDGVLIRSYSGSYCSELIPMQLIIDLGSPAHGKSITSGSTYLPFTYEIDYVRTYQMDMDCSTVINSCSWDINTYDNKVKESITFGGSSSSCSNTINSGGSKYLKATDYIEIDGNFTVNSGGIFVAETVSCY